MDGAYAVGSVATTRDSAGTVPPGAELRLDALLESGVAVLPNERSSEQTIVVLDGIKAHYRNQAPIVTKARSTRCTKLGKVEYEFQFKASGESFSDGDRTVRLILQRASDSSLIVHQIIHTCGQHFAVIGGCHDLNEWCQQAPNFDQRPASSIDQALRANFGS